jgi:cysteine synthase A
MARIASDITWLVGRTPLVELARIAPPGTRLLGKLESWSPSGSNKDRAALGMIRHAEKSGFLGAGGTIVECSSGDLGLAIATIGRRLGYRVVLTMPEGMRGAMVRAEQIAKQTAGAICLQAFSNRANARAHAETTAREIWEDTDGKIDLVVAPVGTGGTAAGCVAFFRELGVPVAGVQPAASPTLTGGRAGVHDIPGLGAGFIPEILDPSSLAHVVDVTDAEAVAGARALARNESLLLGPASGAVLHAALELARRPGGGYRMVVAVLPDTVHHYLDHAVLRAAT